MTAQGGRLTRFAATSIATLLLAPTLALGVAGCGDDPGETTTDAVATVPELPAPRPVQSADTLEFLDGDGAALLEMHAVASELGASPGGAACEGAVATLNESVDPKLAYELASEIPDEAMRTALFAERTSLAELLGLCVERESEEQLSAAATQLAEHAGAVELRLGQLESGQ